MLGHYPLWRRKKMRYFIAGCLGISVVASLMLVLGTIQGNPQTLMLQQDTLQGSSSDNNHFYRDLYGSQRTFQDPVRRRGSPLNNQLHRNVPSQTTVASLLRVAIHQNNNGLTGNYGNSNILQQKSNKPKEYNSDDGNYQGDTGYYSNEDEEDNQKDKVPSRKAAAAKVLGANLADEKHHHDYGFVIEDNAADYNKDYNDEDEDNEDYQEEAYEDDYNVNPPFKPGDFDYSLLNKTNVILPGVKLKYEEVDAQKGAVSLNNGSHVYNAVQYKSMHLLENTQQQDKKLLGQWDNSNYNGDDVVADNADYIQNASLPRKLSQNVIRQHAKVVNDVPQGKEPHGKTKTDVYQPCIAGHDCQIKSNRENILLRPHNDDIVENKPKDITKPGIHLTSHQNNATLFHHLNYKLGSQDGKDTPVKLSQQVLLQNIKEKLAESRIKLQSQALTVDKIDNEGIEHQWIETQIPIQDGGVDANWLLQDQPATQIQMPELPWQPGEVRSPGGIPLIVDKIFWSKEVEDLIPKGITAKDFQHFLHKLYTTPVHEMRAPQWNRCGRPRNQYVVLRDGTALCARHREEHVKLIHGEVLSFYLSRILGLDNVPIVVLSRASRTSPQWQGMDLAGAGWNESSLVALIEWVDGLESERSRVKMPPALLEAFERGGVFDCRRQGVHELRANNLTELVQWSDMILFDYLTGHYDRVASMQDGAEREHKPSIMHENIRNLRKVWQTSKMWLIDNESGLFDGYELLYHGGEMGRKFVDFHIQMLQTNCVFRRETVQKIFQLASLSSPHEELVRYASAQDPLYKQLPYAKESLLFQKYFPIRLKEVVDWIKKCLTR